MVCLRIRHTIILSFWYTVMVNNCKIDSCPKSSVARGMCQGHYKRFMKYGDPLLGGTPRSTETDPYRKVMERVEISSDLDECWIWTGSQETFGHGNVRVNGGSQKVHRIVYVHHNGSIDSSVLVRHTCDNPPCVNPKHLITGTHADNNRDMSERRRSPHGVGHHESKLSAEMVSDIRTRFVEGSTYNTLATDYSVSRTTIVNLIKGKTYKYV